jgi:hypothetical protein
MIIMESIKLTKLRLLSRLLLIFSILIITAWAKEVFRNPVPVELEEVVQVVDMPGVRVWSDFSNQELHADIVQSIHDEPEGMFPSGRNGEFQYSYPYQLKTRYQVRWVPASWAALAAASKHSASWRTICQYLNLE